MKRKILVIEPFNSKHIEKISAAAGSDFEVEQILANGSSKTGTLFTSIDKAAQNTKLKNALKEAEIVVGIPSPELLQNPEENCPNLKFVQMTWAGADIYTRNVLPFPKGVLLANASGAYGMTISQFVICQILSLMLNFKDYHKQQENKIWEKRAPILSLENARVLIFGAGDIGTQTARRLTGFNCYTVGVCRNTSKPRQFFNELCTLDEAEKFIPQADVIVCCIPNTDETAGYMDSRRLNLMKQNSVIVNVGRGNFIDCLSLDEVLKGGKIWGAALDVTNPEPLPPDHPLWENSRCIITPHTSGVGFGHLEATVDLLCNVACENIELYVNNQNIKNRIY